jgi:hypothetical protein
MAGRLSRLAIGMWYAGTRLVFRLVCVAGRMMLGWWDNVVNVSLFGSNSLADERRRVGLTRLPRVKVVRCF